MRNIFLSILKRRHFWRYATFSEVGELYLSRVLRMIAINISSTLVSIYLYQNGFSALFILGYWACYFGLKIFMALPLATYAARFGPKHGILLSNILYIPPMILYTMVPEYGLPLLITAGILQGASATLYNICYNIDFSKVKKVEHAGKEIAFMSIFERVAVGVSPLIGGFLALVAGPAASIWVSAFFFAIAAGPLFTSGEPVRTHQKLVFCGFSWRLAIRSMIANVGLGLDTGVSGTIWSFFVAITIIGVGSGNGVYAVIGILSSVVVVASILFSYLYGVLIDKKRGGTLYHAGIIADMIVHFTRPFAQTTLSVGLINTINEAATSAYSMAFTRGMFDVADRTGHRVTYVALMEVMINIGSSLAFVIACLMIWISGVQMGLRQTFIVIGCMLAILFVARFPLYRR